MGVKEAIETLDRFCTSQDHWCSNCPIAKNADQFWFDWGCPIAQVIDDTIIREAIAEMED